MSLFHKYENKTLLFLINYLNASVREADPLNEDEIRDLLLGKEANTREYLTPPELVDDILNQSDFPLQLLAEWADGTYTPVMDWPCGIMPRTTTAERSWLKYILADPKAELIGGAGAVNALARSLAHDDTLLPIQDYVDVNQLASDKRIDTTMDAHILFDRFIQASRNGQLIEYQTDGETIKEALPHKILYNQLTNQFFAMLIDLSSQELHQIRFEDIRGIATKASDSSDYRELGSKIIEKHAVKEPIVVQVLGGGKPLFSADGNMALDRFARLFAPYSTTSYLDENQNMISQINYYDFQYDEVLTNLLTLGPHVKVLAPQRVVDDIVKSLNLRVQNHI